MKIASHAVVTGGSSGIGKATAKLLAQRGSHVTLLARRPDVLAAARDEISAATGSPDQVIQASSVDVTDRSAVERAVAEATARCGPCDLLIASAGYAYPALFEDLSIDIFERTMDVNYFGTLYAVRAVVPAMRSAGNGRIVLISSGLGIVGMYGYAAYCPTKFALRGLAETLRGELRRFGIAVSIVYPPDTDTPQLAAEELTKPPETKAIAANAKTWGADAVAAKIIEGIDRHRFAITPGWEMTWLYRLHSLIQPGIHWYFDHVSEKARRGA